ncbi:hypothetical protein RJ639_043229 [Escallonia herrerae]|uniref:Uncharacterized protein n=1 Tax=Escallonia herrerae TaxID=1293975 RepID=A0AA89B131_9ASTE|nr:hypothetical protein RJ639_043229 [Escallonia herrerae]
MDHPPQPNDDPTTNPTAKEDEPPSPPPTVLDLTSFQLHDLDSVELPPSLTELDLTTNRLSSLDPRIGHLSNLKILSFRQNLLTDAGVEPISRMMSIIVHNVSLGNSASSFLVVGCQELVLRDNQIRKIPDVSIFKRLLVFDVSYNEISTLNGLSAVSNTLKELYVSKNEECIAVEELYLSHNGISKMEGLSTLVNLRVLDVSANKLTAVNGIENLNKLEDLWLNDNQISSLEGLSEAVAGSREKLTTIYLEHNPCAKSPNYITTLRQIFPKIEQIDSEVFA